MCLEHFWLVERVAEAPPPQPIEAVVVVVVVVAVLVVVVVVVVIDVVMTTRKKGALEPPLALVLQRRWGYVYESIQVSTRTRAWTKALIQGETV